MLRTRVLAFVLVLTSTGVAAHAQTADFLIGWSSCQQLKDECEYAIGKDDLLDEIYRVALLGGDHPGSSLGTCYVHDNQTPPGTTYPYACYNYVKISTLQDPKGPGGTNGCVGYTSSSTPEESRKQAAQALLQLCASGACCCPQVAKQPCGKDTNHPVTFHDTFTGSCCTFPNHCSLPSGWPPSGWQVPSGLDCQ